MEKDLKLSGKTISCPVCGKNTALEEEADKIKSYLCVSCGYTTNSLFTDNSQFAGTPKTIVNLKFYDKEKKLYWIPTVINMPNRGLIFPEKHGKQIIWTHVPVIKIPKEEQKNYPIPNSDKFFNKKLDPEQSKKFTDFSEALKEMGAIIELDELKENIKEK